MIEAKKSLGQHWLKDNYILDLIVEEAELSPDQLVLEIGPGTGNLTEKLLTKSDNVTAVELDERLINKLVKRFNDQILLGHLRILNEDIRYFDFNNIKESYKIVANIPYYLTSYLIRLLADSSNKPDLVVLLIQKEVAERLSALPGKMSLLSVVAQLNFDIKKGELVPAYLFEPIPKVDSQIVILSKKNKNILDNIDSKELIKFISLGFSMRRKKLVNNLVKIFEKDLLTDVLEKLKINLSTRPQDLSINQWQELFVILYKK